MFIFSVDRLAITFVFMLILDCLLCVIDAWMLFINPSSSMIGLISARWELLTLCVIPGKKSSSLSAIIWSPGRSTINSSIRFLAFTLDAGRLSFKGVAGAARGDRGAGWEGGDISPRLPKNFAAILPPRPMLGEEGAGDDGTGDWFAIGRLLLSCLLKLNNVNIPAKEVLASDGQVRFKRIILTLANFEQHFVIQINH
jgi:hypothetical protein